LTSLPLVLRAKLSGDGVRINDVKPGVVWTSQTEDFLTDPESRARVAGSIPMNRVSMPDEIAKPIVWLLSEEASLVSGCLLEVSGGGFVIGSEGGMARFPSSNQTGQ